jgi:hypothetical protein
MSPSPTPRPHLPGHLLPEPHPLTAPPMRNTLPRPFRPQGICYLSDASYFRAGYLPSWYMSLRGYLTLIAIASMLSTTAYYLKRDVDRATRVMEEEDAKRVARLEARATDGKAAAVAAAMAAQPIGRK